MNCSCVQVWAGNAARVTQGRHAEHRTGKQLLSGSVTIELHRRVVLASCVSLSLPLAAGLVHSAARPLPSSPQASYRSLPRRAGKLIHFAAAPLPTKGVPPSAGAPFSLRWARAGTHHRGRLSPSIPLRIMASDRAASSSGVSFRSPSSQLWMSPTTPPTRKARQKACSLGLSNR